MDSKPLVLIATGSSATIALPDYLAHIRQELDGTVTVMMTKSAERFVRPEVVGWFADTVITCDLPGVNPVEVALTARAIVVLPSSANTLACAALGLMGTPATTVLAASPSPCLYFPQMNEVIWGKAITKQHVAVLRSRGDTVIEPETSERYEIWRGEVSRGLSMPEPTRAAEIMREWLDDHGENYRRQAS